MINEHFSIQEVRDLLDIDEISAKELLDGTIELYADEVYDLAISKCIPINKLFNMLLYKQ